jgi:CRP/FNR family cyclic AMP-dependent transcriptional regulator
LPFSDRQDPRRHPSAPNGGQASRWPPAERTTSFRCLLDLDADLAEELDADSRRVARAAATTVTFRSDLGCLSLSEWLVRAHGGPGLLVLEGILALNVRVGDRVSAELLGPGDLLQTFPSDVEQLVSCEAAGRALVPMRFALLDAGFARRVRFWPQISQALLQRTAARIVSLNIQRAIAAQPRLEVRLALLLWHLAGRWGKVERGGIRLGLPLTHQLLGQLIGAERPSVSHALSRLAAMRLVTGHGDEWHLHGSLEDQLPSMIEAHSGRAEQIVAAVAALRPR